MLETINPSEPTLIDKLLADQRELSAVTRFSRQHARQEIPAQAKYYRDLIPLSLPKKGEQYAFEVDLDKCSGCKACVTACHNLNGLAENETWRSVGSLHGGTAAEPVHKTVTTACHHCVDPACLNGCPVLAYEKDPVTGIVHHLDDQCIGCSYCVMKCPYEVPQYHKKKGIVRKCDMCSSRLLENEAPACVQSCPNEAIRITVVGKAQIATETTTRSQVVPGAPASNYTIPTTRYRTERELPANTQPADFTRLKPAAAHPPLVIMLVLTQLSVGMFCVAALGESLFDASGIEFQKLYSLAALSFGGLGLAASTLHLGRPLQAWRAFLGWRKSWLSREIIFFGVYFHLAAAQIATLWFPLPVPKSLLEASVVISGLIGVFCSVMVYVDTRRTLWSLRLSGAKFFGTTILLGVAASVALSLVLGNTVLNLLIAALIIISAAKLGWEAKCLTTGCRAGHSTAKKAKPLNANSEVATAKASGSTGDPPVPGGDSPPGTGETHELFCTSFSRTSVASVPSGQWPDGTGGSPVLPVPTSEFRLNADEATTWSAQQSARLQTGILRWATVARFVCGSLGGMIFPGALLALTHWAALEFVPGLSVGSFALCLAGELLERHLFFTTVVAPKMPGGLFE